MSKTNGSVLALMDTLMTNIRSKNAAQAKAATDPSEPTTHPVMKADDGTAPAREGSRSSENVADVKKDYGGAGNTGQEDANSASSEKPSDSIGTQSQASDEVKGNVQDPPKTVPPKPPESPDHQSNQTFNEKYSSADAALKAGNAVLAKLASSMTKTAAGAECASENASGTKTPVTTKTETTPAKGDAKTIPPPPKEKTAQLDKKAAAQKYKEDAEAGFAAAEFLAHSLGLTKESQAVNAATEAELQKIVKAAEADADIFCDYMEGHAEATQKSAGQKKAEGAMIPPELLAGAGPAAGADAGGLPPELMGGGGMPPEGGMGGPEMGGAGMDEEAVLDALAQALAEEGVTPEQLAEAVAGAEGGGMGGGEGGLPAPAAPPAPAGDMGGGTPPGAKPEGEKSTETETSSDSAEKDKGKEEDKGEKKEGAVKSAQLVKNLRAILAGSKK